MSTTLRSAPNVTIARSFPEALHLANKVDLSGVDKDELACWIVGGERLYSEALNHPSAQELHLTIVDTDIDVSNQDAISKFPAKYRWDRHFAEISRYTHEFMDSNDKRAQYSHIFYSRK